MQLVEQKLLVADVDLDSDLDVLCGYIDTVCRFPLPIAMQKLSKFMNWLPDPRQVSVHIWGMMPHQRLVETIMLRLTRDQSVVGSLVRKILNEEEAIVRKRVHSDTQRIKRAAGL